MSKVSLSVVIGTYNRIEILKQCLASLIGKVQVKNEIIVVDAGSTDGTIEYLHQLKGIRVICDNKLIGQAKSLNNVALPGMLDHMRSSQHPIIFSEQGLGLVNEELPETILAGVIQNEHDD